MLVAMIERATARKPPPPWRMRRAVPILIRVVKEGPFET